MGRHTSARHDRDPDARRRRGPVLAAAALTATVLAALGWVVLRAGDETSAGTSAGTSEASAEASAEAVAGCRAASVVRVAVDPDLVGPVRAALDGPLALGEGRCAVAEVSGVPSATTLAELRDGAAGTQPQVWVPDDVSWAERAGAAVEPAVAELAATPVVLATSRAVADGLGWTASPPTWAQALLSTGAVLPDPRTEAAGALALAALRASAGEAGDAAVDAVLGEGRTGSTVPQALAAAVAGDPAAPVVVATEQQVATATPEGRGELAVVVPVEGAPTLVVPVLRTAAGGATADGSAVDAVLDRLVAQAADGAAVRAWGWRDTIGRFEGGAPAPPELPVAADLVVAVLARAGEQPGAP